MDFPTFCILMNLLKIYQESNDNSQGFLNYFNLYSSGLTIHTYYLIKNFAKLMVKEDIIFKSLNFGVKINSLIQFDKNKKIASNNLEGLNSYSSKFSLENLFLVYRLFEMVHFNRISYPFSINRQIFNKCLENSKNNPPTKEEELISSILKNSSQLIEKSFQDFQAISVASGLTEFTRDDYNKFIFNILDLNNSTYLEIYELMLLDKVSTLFGVLNQNMIIITNIEGDTQNDNYFNRKLKDFNTKYVYQINENELDYLYHVYYKDFFIF